MSQTPMIVKDALDELEKEQDIALIMVNNNCKGKQRDQLECPIAIYLNKVVEVVAGHWSCEVDENHVCVFAYGNPNHLFEVGPRVHDFIEEFDMDEYPNLIDHNPSDKGEAQ